MDRRYILHVDCDAFFASVEQVCQPSLRAKPIAVGDRMVIAASYEARAFGVKVGMPFFEAKRLCKELLTVKPRHDIYLQYSQCIAAVLRRLSPLVEAASVDEFYIDMTGTVFAHRGTVEDCCKKIQQLILKEIGVGVSIGIASTKFCAKMASKYRKPLGVTALLPQSEKSFLAKSPLRDMHGVGSATFAFLESVHCKTIADLAALDVEVLQLRFGKRGFDLWQKAHGIDSSEVIASQIQKSIGHALTYYQPTKERSLLLSRLRFLLEKCCFRLRGIGALSSTVSVSVRYTDFSSVDKSRSLLVATDSEEQIYELASMLFDELYDGRSFVRLLSISLSSLSFESRQMDLFRDPRLDDIAEAMDEIRDDYGFASIMTARALEGKNN